MAMMIMTKMAKAASPPIKMPIREEAMSVDESEIIIEFIVIFVKSLI
jgi:hypothetical protein